MDDDLDRVIGDCAVYRGGHRLPGRLPLTQARACAEREGGYVWVGLQQPRPDQVIAVADDFDLPRLAVDDSLRAHQRPKLELYGDVLFVILKPVRYVDHDEVVEVCQLALFVGPHFVVSVRHGDSDVLRRVRAELDGGPRQPGPTPSDPRHTEPPRTEAPDVWHGPVRMLYRAADLVVDGYEDALGLINEDIDRVETQVFDSADGQDHSERIYKLKREIAEFRRAVLPLQPPLARLADGQVPGVNGGAAPYFRDVLDHLLRAGDAIEAHDRLLSDVLQANMTRVATLQNQIALRQNEIALRQNEDMRRISAWAAIGLVPTAIAGIYGMNFDNIPELHWRYGYYAVVTVIVGVCTTLYRLFRRNDWL